MMNSLNGARGGEPARVDNSQGLGDFPAGTLSGGHVSGYMEDPRNALIFALRQQVQVPEARTTRIFQKKAIEVS